MPVFKPIIKGAGGGGDIYRQTIVIDGTKSNETFKVCFSIYTKSNVSINTLAKLKTALNNSFISSSGGIYRRNIEATGLLAIATTSVYNITSISYAFEDKIEIKADKHDTSGGGLSGTSKVIDTYSLTFDNTVWKVI